MPDNSLKIPYGEHQGELVHVSHVAQGLACECVCPVCQSPLVARKGEKKKHHFAHYTGAVCSAETLLHQLGKRLLYQRLASALAKGESLPMSWHCPDCDSQHQGNLVKVAASVVMEKALGPCRPEVALLKEDGQPAALLEVVVSHKPDDNVLAYVAEHKATLVEFHINSDVDLEEIGQSSLLKPTKVNLCLRPKCVRCRRPLRLKTLHVVDGTCWKCTAAMKIAFLDFERIAVGPESFSPKDIQLARQLGVELRNNYSRTAGERYVSSTCRRCGTFLGNHFLLDYVDLITPQNGHQVGYACMGCEGYEKRGIIGY